MKMTLEEALAHIPGEITPEIAQCAKDLLPSYIFTRRKSNHQYGYCTYCGASWENDIAMRHNSQEICPKCRVGCTVKASGRGHKTLWDEGYFVYYQKSRINPKAIVAVGYSVVRDYSKTYLGVKTKFHPRSLYIFIPSKGGTAFQRNTWYSTIDNDHYFVGTDFTRAGQVKCQYNRGHLANVWTDYSRESIAQAAEGTPFQYSGWQDYNIDDMTEFFDLAAKYQSVEYLTKLGFGELVRWKLTGQPTYSAVYWRGKTMAKVLRLSDQQLAEVKRAPGKVNPFVLRILQAGKKDGSNLSLDEAVELSGKSMVTALVGIPYGTLRKRLAYIQKQAEDKEHYSWDSLVFTAWTDYLKDCERLEMDLTQESVIFPRNLYQAHQNTIAQVKIKGDAMLDKKIKAFREKIKGYCFRHRGLLIRPAKSTRELIDEGKALNHCVGIYATGYARGDYAILVIRKVLAPWKPYYTVQVYGDRVSQCYGRHNSLPTKQIEEFLEVFKAQKLEPKNKEVVV